MINMSAKIMSGLRRFVKRERGAVTVEFALVFPFFVGMFVSSFDVAMMNIRSVMLERATDIVVREIRLSSGATIAYDDVLESICALTVAIPDCTTTVKIELKPVTTATWGLLDGEIDCIKRDEEIQPDVKFENGQENQMMLVRVCAVVDPIFPGIGVGRSMPKDTSGGYQIVASSAFVNEPK